MQNDKYLGEMLDEATKAFVKGQDYIPTTHRSFQVCAISCIISVEVKGRVIDL